MFGEHACKVPCILNLIERFSGYMLYALVQVVYVTEKVNKMNVAAIAFKYLNSSLNKSVIPRARVTIGKDDSWDFLLRRRRKNLESKLWIKFSERSGLDRENRSNQINGQLIVKNFVAG